METIAAPAFIALLRDPERTAALSLRDWSALIATARSANLLGLLAERLHDAGVAPPAQARRHLDATRQLGARQRQSVAWEVHELGRVLAPLGIPVVLLKGAAYAMSGHPVSRGRLFGDIDVLVPRPALGAVEVRLMTAGWTSAKASPYDQRYYRQWMHELPPMMHVRRGTMLDVHHTILPLTARHSPDPRLILEAAAPLAAVSGIGVPAAEHLLIHSIVHLLHEGELHNGLRDLFDIDGLVRTGAHDAHFWRRVRAAAHALQLAAPVALGLHLARQIVHSPIPDEALAGLQADSGAGSPSRTLGALYRAALKPECELAGSASARLARLAIYLRAHWLRMPPHLLARHLARKALQRLDKKEPALEGRA